MHNNDLKILIVDDHHMILEGLRTFLESAFPKADLSFVSTPGELFSHIENNDVDILLLDLMLKKHDSRNFLSNIRETKPNIKIIIFSSIEEENIIYSLIQNGVSGYVTKSSPTHFISDAIHAVLKNESYIDPIIEARFKSNNLTSINPNIHLTRREKEVLNETLQAQSIKEIANKLCVSEKTVEYHRTNIFAKFQVSNVQALIKKAFLLGYHINKL